jgi:catechol-2,3-dioxygenase
MNQPTFTYGKLPARDTRRARRFYAETLGVQPYAERDDHLYYHVGGTRFMIFAATRMASGGDDQLGVVVTDLT